MSNGPQWPGYVTSGLALVVSGWSLWRTRGHRQPSWRLELQWTRHLGITGIDDGSDSRIRAIGTLRNTGDGAAYGAELDLHGCEESGDRRLSPAVPMSPDPLFRAGNAIGDREAVTVGFKFDGSVEGATVTLTWYHPPRRRRQRSVTWTLVAGEELPVARRSRFVDRVHRAAT